MFREFQLKHGVLLIAVVAVVLQILGMASSSWLAVEKSASEHNKASPKDQAKGALGALVKAKLKGDRASTQKEGVSGGAEVVKNRDRRSAASDDASGPSSANERKQPLTGKESGNQRPNEAQNLTESANTEYQPMSDRQNPPSRPSAGRGPRPGPGGPSGNNMARPLGGRNTPKPSNNENDQPSDGSPPVPTNYGGDRPTGGGSPPAPTNTGGNRPTGDGESRPAPTNNGNNRPAPTNNGNNRPAPTNNGNNRPTGDRQTRPAPTKNGNNRPTRPAPTENGNNRPTRPAPTNNGTNRPTRPAPTNNGNNGPTRPAPTNNGTNRPTRPAPTNNGNNGPSGNGRPFMPTNNGSRPNGNGNQPANGKDRPNGNRAPVPSNNGGNGPNNLIHIPQNTGKPNTKDLQNVPSSWRRNLGAAAQSSTADESHSNTYSVLTVGLWKANLCFTGTDQDETCKALDVEAGLDNLLLVSSSLVAYGLTVSTWHSLRVETVIAVVFCLAGLVATVLGARPMFERLGRKRAVVITSVLCMVMSCILYLVAVSRVAALNQSLRAEFRDLGGEFVVYVPWSVVVGGIGACLAFVAASLQAFCAWYEERRKWAKFQNEVAFSNAEESNATTAPPVSRLDISFDMANKGMQRETET